MMSRRQVPTSSKAAWKRTSLWVALLLATLTVFPLSSGHADATPQLFVFASTDIRPRALEQELSSGLPGVQVRVFGRARELKSAVTEQPVAAVMARTVVLQSLGRAPALKGQRGGNDEEPYVLLSVGSPVKPTELSGKTIGAVDLVGRHDMNAFVSRILGVPAPKLKRVTTERDLLPLLQFGAVVAVLLPERWVRVIDSKSKLDLKKTVLPQMVGLPAVWFPSPSARAALEPKIKAMSAGLNGRLGVDKWK